LQSEAVDRILDVQAVVSRTYAVANLGRHRAEGFDLCDGTHCQLYRRPLRTEHDNDLAARAVAHTHGQLITFGGRPIQAVFHSSCGGHTAAAEDVWNGAAVSYLRPVPDWFCSRGHEVRWEFTTDEQQIRRALNADGRTAMGGRLDRIDIVQRDAAGRAALIAVAGTRKPMVRAEEFRSVMRQAFGPKSIQSTWFTVTRSGDQFRFTGVGYGHGVGLCQAGAALRAQAGQTPATILAHYYPGTHVESVSALASVISRRILTPPAQ
jgi:stage II sporulation protein D